MTTEPRETGTDPLHAYIKDLPNTRLLTRQEVVKLAEQRDQGNEEARNEIVRRNLRLVIPIARGYSLKTNTNLLDCIQDGNIGLMRAADKYDPKHGTQFSTYATNWVKQAISRGISNTSRTIRLPVHVDEEQRKLARHTTRLQQELLRPATTSEIATSMGITNTQVEQLQNVVKDSVSLDVMIGEGQTTLGDLVADTDTQTPEESTLGDQQLEELRTAIRTLDEDLQEVIKLRFGLDDQEPLALSNASTRLGKSRQKVKRMEEQAIEQIKGALETTQSELVEEGAHH